MNSTILYRFAKDNEIHGEGQIKSPADIPGGFYKRLYQKSTQEINKYVDLTKPKSNIDLFRMTMPGVASRTRRTGYKFSEKGIEGNQNTIRHHLGN